MNGEIKRWCKVRERRKSPENGDGELEIGGLRDRNGGEERNINRFGCIGFKED